MKDFAKVILKYAIVTFVSFIGGNIFVSWLKNKQVSFSPAAIMPAFWITFFAVGGLLIYDLMKILDGKGKKKKGKAIDKVTDAEGKEVSQYFNRDFLTEKELENNSGFNYHTNVTIRSSKKDGILVRAEEKNGTNMEINFVEPIHTLCVGTTSSGKTWRYVVPTIQLMSMTASKPSFVVTDPKGELYDNCSNKLKSEGYDVKVLDLRNPSASMQWNPLTYPYQMYQRSFNLDQEVKIHPAGDNPKNYNLIIQRSFDFASQEWFEFNGIAYVDRDVLENDMKVLGVAGNAYHCNIKNFQ